MGITYLNPPPLHRNREKNNPTQMTGKDAIARLPNRIDAVGAGLTTNVTVFGNNVFKPALLSTAIGKK
ncbi:MAG: hypothetical protein RIG27_27120 [Coleofasciculus sp. F4-SAH-05]